MKTFALKLCFIYCVLYSQTSLAASITSVTTTPFSFSADSETLSISGNGSLNINTGVSGPAVRANSKANLSVSLNTTSAADGIIATGTGGAALDFSTGSLSSLQITSGTISGQASSTALISAFTGTSLVQIGQASGDGATLSNSATGGSAFLASGSSNTNLTFNINATGSVVAHNDQYANAIKLTDSNSGSTITLNNAGTINDASSAANAILVSGYVATINNSGTINGGVNFSTNSNNSSILQTAGTINGTISFSSATQSFHFDGGTLNGTLGGAGAAFLAADTSVTLSNRLYTGIIQGKTAGVGNVILNINDSLSITSTLGGTNGLASLTVRSDENTRATIRNNVKATNISITNVSGSSAADSYVNLDNNLSMTGAITIGDNAVLKLYGNNVINGTIDGTSSGVGNLEIGNSGTITVSDIGNIGSISKLDNITILSSATLDASTNNSSINVNNTTLNSGSTLILGSGTFSGAIDGSGSNTGNVVINAPSSSNVTFDGLVGATNTINSFVVNGSNGAEVNLTNDVSATNISVNSSSGTTQLSFTGLDEQSITEVSSTVTLGENTILQLNNSSRFIGTVNGSADHFGSLTLAEGTAADTISNIGNIHALKNVTLKADSFLELYNTNASLAADDIILENNSQFSTGSGAISGAVQGVTSSRIYLEQDLNLQNGTMMHGSINGNTSGKGDINATGTVLVADIGTTTSVNSFTSAVGSTTTFEGDLNVNSNINIQGNAIFTQSTTNVTTNSAIQFTGGNSLSFTISDVSATSLQVVGEALLAPATHLNLNIATAVSSGATITLIDASAPSTLNAISDSNININGSGSNIYNGYSYSTSVIGNKLLVNIASVTPLQLNFDNKNSQNSFNTIMEATSPSGNLVNVKSYFENNAVTLAQKEAVAKSIAPQVDNSFNRIMFNNISASADLISARMNGIRHDLAFCNGTNSATLIKDSQSRSTLKSYDCAYQKNLWAQAFGGSADQRNTNLSDGYDARTAGGAFGFDKRFGQHFILGLGGNYSHSNIDSKNNAKKTTIDSYQISIYSGYQNGAFFMNSMVAAALNNYHSTRSIQLVEAQTKAKYNGKTYSARLELGANFRSENNLIFTPTLMVTAAKNSVDDYNETGAGTLNLHVKNASANFLEARFGTELSKFYKFSSGGKFRPSIKVSYGYDFAADSQKASANFIGQSFIMENNGARIDAGSFKAGAGLEFFNAKTSSISLNYGFERRNNFNAHSGWLVGKIGF